MTILDWRDADMPVLVLHKPRGKPVVLIEATPAEVQKIARYRMRKNPAPNWRDDRTYFMRIRQEAAKSAIKDSNQ